MDEDSRDEPKIGQRPIAERVRDIINKCEPVVQSLEPKFQEFSDVIDLVKLALRGLAKYHWYFISDEHRKLIHAARQEDDYSGNVTLIGRLIRRYAASSDLTIRQRQFIDRIYYVLGRCLQSALELYEESEKDLIREGVKIYMSESDGYGEHERLNASLWDFQKKFHQRQLDSSRGSNKAIIYPPTGFGTGGSSFQVRDFSNGKYSGILSEQDQGQLKELLDALRNPDIIRGFLNGNAKGPEDDNGYRHIPNPVPTPKAPSGAYETGLTGILKKGARSADVSNREKGARHVHWRDSDKLELPSPVATGGPPPSGSTKTDNTPPRVPSTPVGVPQDRNSRPPPAPFGSHTFTVPLSPISISSSDSETPPSTPPPVVPVGGTEPTVPDSSSHPEVKNAAEEEPGLPSDQPPSTSPSSSPSWSLPSVGSPTATESASDTDSGTEYEADGEPKTGDQGWIDYFGRRLGADAIRKTLKGVFKQERPRASAAEARAAESEETRKQAALAVRAYLGPRHDEYSTALPRLLLGRGAGRSTTTSRRERERDSHDSLGVLDPALLPTIRRRNIQSAADVRATALLHWAGVRRARRQERLDGRGRLRAFLKWADREGRVPLSPSSIRASTGLRRGLFERLGPPEVEGREERGPVDPDVYRDAALEILWDMQPRLDMTWAAFLFNQDALRLFGGLVGEQPQPRELRLMTRLLRELELYAAVCNHRCGLIVGHLRRTREFPTALGAQLGDLQAALRDAEEAQLSAAHGAFDYVAARSRRVMTYPAGRRAPREFAGVFGRGDREKLEYWAEVEEDGAEALLAGLAAAEGWLAWCRRAIADWTLGWRPDRVETLALYVGEGAQADVRRYRWEINQQRHNIGLKPLVKRPLDKVYERQQAHIKSVDILWRLTSPGDTGQ